MDRGSNKFQSSQNFDQTNDDIDITNRALLAKDQDRSLSLAKKRLTLKNPGNSHHPTFGGGNKLSNNHENKPTPQKDPGLLIKEQFVQKLTKNMTLSAKKLQRHIYERHPRQMDAKKDHYDTWSIYESIPALINFPCCMKRKVTKIQRSLGLGASLYLMTLKAYIKLFVVVSILSVPTILLVNK